MKKYLLILILAAGMFAASEAQAHHGRGVGHSFGGYGGGNRGVFFGNGVRYGGNVGLGYGGGVTFVPQQRVFVPAPRVFVPSHGGFGVGIGAY